MLELRGLLRRSRDRLGDRDLRPSAAELIHCDTPKRHDDPQHGDDRQYIFCEHFSESSATISRWIWRNSAFAGTPRTDCQAAAAARSSIFDDTAVVHVGDPVAELEDAVVVGDDDHGAVGPDGDLAEQFHDGQAGLVVERGGRLVADQELGS